MYCASITTQLNYLTLVIRSVFDDYTTAHFIGVQIRFIGLDGSVVINTASLLVYWVFVLLILCDPCVVSVIS